MAQDAAPPRGAPATDIDPFTPERILNPYAWHAELREMGAMVWLNKYGCYFAPRYAECFAIVADHGLAAATIAARRVGSENMSNPIARSLRQVLGSRWTIAV